MEKEIVKDQFILSQKSIDASLGDLDIVVDLLDTIKAHQQSCVGIAANMIGELKRIMVVLDEGQYLVIMNPKILKSIGKYETKESCLCHIGEKTVTRYNKIKVEYRDQNFKKKIKTFTGFTAQIIQHEIDHFEGILI